MITKDQANNIVIDILIKHSSRVLCTYQLSENDAKKINEAIEKWINKLYNKNRGNLGSIFFLKCIKDSELIKQRIRKGKKMARIECKHCGALNCDACDQDFCTVCGNPLPK